MGEIHIKLEPDHMPKTTAELVEYLRTTACVDYDTGFRRMPNYTDDEVFRAAADLIERFTGSGPPKDNLADDTKPAPNYNPAAEIIAGSAPQDNADDHRCPICAEPLKADDICATDITEGTCHAECLAGSPVVDLDTGDEIPGGKIDTYPYSEVMEPAPPKNNVRVKPLEWNGYEAQSPVGHYRVQRLDDKWEPLRDGYYMLPRLYGTVKAFDTFDQAKEHAEDDYRKRALSIIENLSPQTNVTGVDLVAKIAQVASGVGFQAGVPALDIAGQILSILAANPEHIDRFMIEGTELFLDGTFNYENGSLTYRAMNGSILSPSDLREKKGQQQ